MGLGHLGDRLCAWRPAEPSVLAAGNAVGAGGRLGGEADDDRSALGGLPFSISGRPKEARPATHASRSDFRAKTARRGLPSGERFTGSPCNLAQRMTVVTSRAR